MAFAISRRSVITYINCRASSQYPKRRLFVRSRKVSKPRDWYFKLSYRFEIWQAHRQHCCRSACQISERSDNSKYKSRGFETWRDLTERRLFGYWDGALVPHSLKKIIYTSMDFRAWINNYIHLNYVIYRKVSNIRRTKFQNLNASRLIL